ncbi:putative ribonuclease H1 large subunit [Besnoitia besnoiti]|uniref:Ribonuclease n=1 Tax=Besnoitia besnoiti TaxID=94643 RepID=A0A2A9LZT2_BESBE|nr:putative ribonuclease H1 large subunit [Besnoitia besnoiti]PFH31229.1 putative ribonuclease H1 large subunit [Besnoitia besnoiti]
MESRLLLPIISSNFNACGGKPVRLGIDEAGRGCVLGAMVYACFFCPAEAEKKELKALNVDDSKRLKEWQREEAFAAIEERKDIFGWSIHAIRPEEISAKMLRKKKFSLNEISHETAISLIQRTVQHGVNVTEVFVDTVGSAQAYQAKLQKRFPSIKIKVAEKADSLFPVVSAASILAKVTRDRMLFEWQPADVSGSETNGEGEKENGRDAPTEDAKSPAAGKRAKDDEEATPQQKKTRKNGKSEGTKAAEDQSKSQKEKSKKSTPTVHQNPSFGSGYPGDSETVAFLNKNCDPVFGFDPLVRYSWSTARLIFEKRGVPVDWYEEVNDDAAEAATNKAKQSRITNFFQAKRTNSAGGIERPGFYIRNKLQLLSELSS